MNEVRCDDGVRLRWRDWQETGDDGAAPPILLVHGFGSDHRRNWQATGWVDFLKKAGWRPLAYDQRGHGASDGPHDPAAYADERLAADAAAVLDAAGVDRAVVMAFSMGSGVSLSLATRRPERVRALCLGGIGANFPSFPTLHESGHRDIDFEVVARALEATDEAEIAAIPDFARSYRVFAERGGQDLLALAACWRRKRDRFDDATLAAVDMPTLLVVGDRDATAGAGAPLARALGNARFVSLPDKDHMKSVGAREHRAAVGPFLESLPPE